jgi:hypothetical protein
MLEELYGLAENMNVGGGRQSRVRVKNENK